MKVIMTIGNVTLVGVGRGGEREWRDGGGRNEEC